VQYAATIILAFAASALGTRAFIDWLTSRKLVAVENERSMHRGAVPQGGGAPVVASIVGVTALLWTWTPALVTLFVAAGALAVMSSLNDRAEIAPRLRLALHAAAAVAVIALLLGSTRVLGPAVPLYLERAIELIGLIWFINLYNFMDGIDGITGVESITIAGGSFAVMQMSGSPSNMSGLALAIVGASGGFLLFNWHRARIFLGDVGSVPLGLLTGAMLLHVAATTSLVAALILPLYYLTDATWTLLRRWKRGEQLWTAHRAHAYQRAALARDCHATIVLRIAACNATLVAAAVLSLTWPVIAVLIAVASVALLMRTLEAIASHRPTIPTPTELGDPVK
jgi:UDP-N-acetylmuramyl pentapeptide phosphotransferase/UDP-N-acetylglucosamine-1-phosphate transferase